jgi:hypothetical protein
MNISKGKSNFPAACPTAYIHSSTLGAPPGTTLSSGRADIRGSRVFRLIRGLKPPYFFLILVRKTGRGLEVLIDLHQSPAFLCFHSLIDVSPGSELAPGLKRELNEKICLQSSLKKVFSRRQTGHDHVTCGGPGGGLLHGKEIF